MNFKTFASFCIGAGLLISASATSHAFLTRFIVNKSKQAIDDNKRSGCVGTFNLVLITGLSSATRDIDLGTIKGDTKRNDCNNLALLKCKALESDASFVKFAKENLTLSQQKNATYHGKIQIVSKVTGDFKSKADECNFKLGGK